MDASRISAVTPDGEVFGISRTDVANYDFANSLRDIADEIEAGIRVVIEVSTTETSAEGMAPESTLHLITSLHSTRE